MPTSFRQPTAAERLAACHPEFLDDLQHSIQHDRRTTSRLLDLVRAIFPDLFSGIGKPEPLRYLGALPLQSVC